MSGGGQVNPDYAAKHQLLVIECLEDPVRAMPSLLVSRFKVMRHAGRVKGYLAQKKQPPPLGPP